MSRREQGNGLLLTSLVMAIVLTIVPLPPMLAPLKPYWVALVMIYWHLEAGRLRHLGQAFVLGLVVDLLTGSLLGMHALSLIILSYLLGRFRARIRFFPPWQQAAAILALLVNDRIVQLWIVVLADRGLPEWSWWLSPLVGVAIWPWLFLGLDALRQRQRLSRSS